MSAQRQIPVNTSTPIIDKEMLGTQGMGMQGYGMQGMQTGFAQQQQFTTVSEMVSPPVVSTTTTGAPGMLGGGEAFATPCHPVTGATGPYPKAAPLPGTTTAYPGMTTFEQTSGLPTSTHMYGVPVATYTKGPGGVATPVATATTGALSGAPMTYTETSINAMPTHTSNLGSGQVLRETTTHVADSYTPIGTAATSGLTGGKGTKLTAPAIPDDVGVHHHDRSHHHHVHDRLPLGTNQQGLMGSTATGAPATVAPGSTGGNLKAKAIGDMEHQIIQDVIPPGRNRVVEHHEKY